ncbi:MAG: hypothetical protein M5U17_03800 [Ignavibacterium sp.]|nr:hypothetical protein [Ignavibacterium sp.]
MNTLPNNWQVKSLDKVAELIPTSKSPTDFSESDKLLLPREGLIGIGSQKFFMLTKELMNSFILTTSLSLGKRETIE